MSTRYSRRKERNSIYKTSLSDKKSRFHVPFSSSIVFKRVTASIVTACILFGYAGVGFFKLIPFDKIADLFVTHVSAAAPTPDPSQDGSNGNLDASDFYWYTNSADSRYTGKTGDLGSSTNPYRLKNADELNAFSLLCNHDSAIANYISSDDYSNVSNPCNTGFSGKYITLCENGNTNGFTQTGIDLNSYGGNFGTDGGFSMVQSSGSTNNYGWTPIGTESYPFKGYFDGASASGYIITNLAINNHTDLGRYNYNLGLFGYVDFTSGSGYIKNVNLTKAQVKTTIGSAGALVGTLKGKATDTLTDNSVPSGFVPDIENCSVSGRPDDLTGLVDIFLAIAPVYVGGIVGTADRAYIDSCSVSNGDIYLNSGAVQYYAAGGIAGNITGDNRIFLIDNTVNNCKISNLVCSESYIGGIAGKLSACGGVASNNSTVDLVVLNTSDANKGNAGGIFGTVQNFYNNKVLYILNCDLTKTTSGVSSVTATGDRIGGIIGYAYSSSSFIIRIQNCDITINQIGTTNYKSYVGGITGQQSQGIVQISGCNVNSEILGSKAVGGIAGNVIDSTSADNTVKGVVTACTFSGKIYESVANAAGSNSGIGGIIGQVTTGTPIIEYCVFTGNIEFSTLATNTYIGGIVGNYLITTTQTLKFCISAGRIKTTANQGSSNTYGIAGIVGRNTGTLTVEKCISVTDIDIYGTSFNTNNSVGGIFGITGLTSTHVKECISGGKLSANGYIGGIVGKDGSTNSSNPSVLNSYFCGTIYANVYACISGGIIGSTSSSTYTAAKYAYSSGLILSPWTASVTGSSSSSVTFNTVYNDKTVSPNKFLLTGALSGSSVYGGRTTTVMTTTANYLGTGSYTYGTSVAPAYPQLSWAADASFASSWTNTYTLYDPSSTFKTGFANAVDNYSYLSTRAWSNITSGTHNFAVSNSTTVNIMTQYQLADNVTNNLTWTLTNENGSTTAGDQMLNFSSGTGTVNSSNAEIYRTDFSSSVSFTALNSSMKYNIARRFIKLPTVSGSGIDADSSPYTPDNAAKLLEVAKNISAGGGFLGSSITLSSSNTYDYTSLPTGSVVVPAGLLTNVPFCGTFNGGGAQIKGFYLSDYTKEDSAFFARVVYGTFTNVSFVNTSLTFGVATDGNTGMAVAVGYVFKGEVSSVNVDADITRNGLYTNSSGACYNGGIVGVSDTSTVKQCYFTGTVGGTNAGYFGCIVGDSKTSGSKITNCFAAAKITGTGDRIGGIASSISVTDVNGCAFYGNITGIGSIGGIVSYSSSSASNTIKNCYTNAYISGTSNGVGGILGFGAGSTSVIQNCYVSGQLNVHTVNSASVSNVIMYGAIAGNYATITNCYYDKQMLGELCLEGSEATDVLETGDNSRGLLTSELMGLASTLGASYTNLNTSTYYPQISYFNTNALNYSKLSTLAVLRFSEVSGSVSQAYSAKSFTASTGGSYSVAVTVPAAVTPYKNPSWVFDLSSAYSVLGSSVYLLNINITLPNNRTIDKTVDIQITPFSDGNGFKATPFGIPDVSSLIDFRDFINSGYGRIGAYYKLTMSGSDVYDMSTLESRWLSGGGTGNRIPIGSTGDFFTGNFLGNNKIISNLKMASGTNTYVTNSNGNVDVGLFSDIVNGSVTNLTISDALFNISTTNSNNVDIGFVAGNIRSSSITNIKTLNCSLNFASTVSSNMGYLYIGSIVGQTLDCSVIDNIYTDASISVSTNSSTPDRLRIGGVTGYTSNSVSISDANTSLYVTNAVSFAQINDTTLTATKVTSVIGGVVGYIGTNNSTYVTNTAFYGSLKNGKFMGGIIGRSASTSLRYAFCASVGTMTTEVASTYMGGLFGYLSSVYTSLANSYSATQMSISPGITAYSGGIAGYSTLTVANSTTVATRTTTTYFDNRASGTNLAIGSRSVTDSALEWTDTAGTYYNTIRMTTLELSADDYTTANGAGYFTDTTHYSYVNGLYPLILFSAGDSTNTFFASDTGLRNKITAASIAVYFVAANDVDSATSTGAYVLYSNAYLSDLSSSAYLKLSSNSKRIAATGDGTASLYTFNAKSTALSGYSKQYYIIPDIRSNGLTDISWYEVCPDGDGFVTDSKYGIYTADQLAGLSLLVRSYNSASSVIDDNGLYLSGSTSLLSFSGITSSLACDIDMSKYNQSVNTSNTKWIPIGKTSDTPFKGIFNGNSKTILNFYIANSGATGDPGTENGLFGFVLGTSASSAQIKNLGMVNGRIKYTAATGGANIGSIAGTLSNYSSITRCFSSILIEINNTDTRTAVNAGGLVGKIQGISTNQDTVTNSYFTGDILSSNSVDYCGGFFGSAEYTSVSSSFIAALSDNSGTSGFGVMAGISNGGLALSNTYCDGPVCGYIGTVGTGTYEGTVNAIETSSLVSTTNSSCPSGLTSGFPLTSTEYTYWKYTAGCYPTLNGFSQSAVISAVPLYINPHAKATTSGNVTYANTSLYYVADQFSYLGSGSYVISNGTSFVKSGTGKAVIRIDYTYNSVVYSRYAAMDMKCWFDNEVDGVFTIYNANELAEFASIVNGTFDTIKPTGQHEHEVLTNETFDKSFLGKTIILGQNIDLSAFTDWTPIGTAVNPFKGTFSGNGYSISGLTINTSQSIAGLFGVALNAHIHDVTLKSGSINFTADTVNTNIGTVAAIAKGTTTIENCSNAVSVKVNSTDKSLTYVAGGLVGSAQDSTVINECYNMSQMTAVMVDTSTSYFGGIAGEINTGTSVTNCYNTGIIAGAGLVGTQVNYMGGIAGTNNGTILVCYNAGVVQNSATLSPIACQGSGTLSDTWYDIQLFANSYSNADVQGFYTYQVNSGTKPSQLSSWSDSVWYFTDANSYPQLVSFMNGSTEQKASSAVSAVSFDFGTGNYISFTTGVMKSTITLNSTQYTIVPRIVDESIGSCTFDKVGTDPYAVSTGKNKGAVYIDATITVDSVLYVKRLYCNVERTLVVRYKFDFSNLLSSSVYSELNSSRNYAAVASGTGSTFMQTGHGAGTIGDPYKISSPEDLAAFSSYVNGGGKTTDTFFILDRPIDMTGVSLTPIGTSTYKFLGIFDGNGYEITGLNIERQGSSALFNYIGIGGKIKNLGIRTARITVLSQSGDMLGGIFAVYNEGTISSCFATGDVELKESSGGGTVVGGLVAVNSGRIQGCYFIADGRLSEAAKTTGIIHWGVEAPNVMVGGLVGENTGKIDGCYAATDIAIRTGYCGNAIVGYNTTTDGITNCYFDSYLQNSYYIPYAYTDSINGNISRNLFAKSTTEMKTTDTAKLLSWDLYSGTYDCVYDPNDGLSGDDPAITTINSGYPYLGVFEMNKYALTDFADNTSMILSLRNQSAGQSADDIMNAICTYIGYSFPKFGSVTVKDAINVSLLDIPNTIDYNVAVKVYGETEGGEPLYVENLTGLGDKKTGRVINTDLFPSNAYRIEITITLVHIDDTYIPWGVSRKWNSILQ